MEGKCRKKGDGRGGEGRGGEGRGGEVTAHNTYALQPSFHISSLL